MLIKTQEGTEIDVNLDDHLDAVKAHFEPKGIVFKSKEELDAERKKFETDKAAEIGSATRKAHEDWENAFSTVFGEKRPDGTKGLDWFIDHGKKLKEKAEKQPDPNPNPGEGRSVKTDALEAQLRDLKTEHEKFLKAQSEKEAEATNKARKAAQRSGIKALEIAGDTPEEKAERINDLDGLIGLKYRTDFDEEGDLVFYSGEDLVTDPETGGQPMKLDKLVKTKFKNFLKPEKEAPKPPVGGTGTKQEDVLHTTPDGKQGVKAKSREEIRQAAWKKGYTMGSKEYKEFMDASLKLSQLEE